MSRTEIYQQSVQHATKQHLSTIQEQMDKLVELQRDIQTQANQLARLHTQNADDLARTLLPIAHAMAKLTDETRQTMSTIVDRAARSHQAALASVRAINRQVESLLPKLQRTGTDNPAPPNPWPPAIISTAIILAALAVIAWRVRMLNLNGF